MDDSWALVVLFGIVLAINLLPAFGPPTWSIIVLYGFNSDLPLPAIVLTGAAAAACGRFILAWAFRWLGDRVPRSMREDMQAARLLFERNRRNGYLALALFALSPVPSAQLFETAGLMKVSLLKFTAAFFAGRIVSYALYAGMAKELRASSLGAQFEQVFSDPVAIAVQLATIAAMIAFVKIPWRRILDRRPS